MLTRPAPRSRDDGFTLIEMLVTMVLVAIIGSTLAMAISATHRSTVSNERSDDVLARSAEALAWARATDYADLGYFESDAGRPAATPVALPLRNTTAGGAPVTESPVLLPGQRPGTDPSGTLSQRWTVGGTDYRLTTWITALPPVGSDTISRAKRVTVRTEWGGNGTPLEGLCTGRTACSVQTVVRTAQGSDQNPTDGSAVLLDSACATGSSPICASWVRSGRVLDGAVMTAGGTLPRQSLPVELYLRTRAPSTSVSARWQIASTDPDGGPARTIDVPLTPLDSDRTRWSAILAPDDLAVTKTPRGDVAPGAHQVLFTVVGQTAAGNGTQTLTATWSYTMSTGTPRDVVTATVVSAPARCTAGTVELRVTGHSLGLTQANRAAPPPHAADTVTVLLPSPSGPSTRHAAAAQTVTPVTEQIGETQLLVSADATWRVSIPATANCDERTTFDVVVHRAADQTRTVIPLTWP